MKKVTIITVAFLFCLFTSGCATVTGTVTGAGTGMIDAPAQTYRKNREAFDNLPILHGLNAVVMGPVGVVTGPVLGFGKGVALDTQWMIDQQKLSKIFGTYEDQSIWRPYTVRWEKTKAPNET